jgi:hypothetical protein
MRTRPSVPDDRAVERSSARSAGRGCCGAPGTSEWVASVACNQSASMCDSAALPSKRQLPPALAHPVRPVPITAQMNSVTSGSSWWRRRGRADRRRPTPSSGWSSPPPPPRGGDHFSRSFRSSRQATSSSQNADGSGTGKVPLGGEGHGFRDDGSYRRRVVTKGRTSDQLRDR